MGTFHDKRYTAFFSIFLQLPSTNPLQNSKKKEARIFTAHEHGFQVKHNSLTIKIPNIRTFIKR